VRCTEKISGDTLARDVCGEPRIELKGQGQMIVCPGNPPQVHQSGKPYEVIHGDMTNLPVLTREQIEVGIERARAWNVFKPKRLECRQSCNRLMPLSWSELLEPYGWTMTGTSGDKTYWRKPMSRDGHHATTNYNGSDRFYCFSCCAPPFEANKPYNRAEVFTLLHCGGDAKDASKKMSRMYFGTRDWKKNL
jgi:hypothetical protein